MLVRCLYASRPAVPLTGSFLDSILEHSRKKNPALGVTGILCVSENLFIQLIEGGRDEISNLYNTIARDHRHEQVRLLDYEEVDRRQFGNWAMGKVALDQVNLALRLKYFPRPELDPFEESGKATLAFLTDLVATGAIIARGDVVTALTG